MVHIQDTALGAGAWLPLLEPKPPGWVAALGVHGQTRTLPRTQPVTTDVRTVSHGTLFHATTAIPQADRLEAAALEAAVTAGYLALAAFAQHRQCTGFRDGPGTAAGDIGDLRARVHGTLPIISDVSSA